MKLYTSYFAKIRKFPEGIIPVSISIKAPNGYSGFQYKKLAPSWNILSQWKNEHDEEVYRMRFRSEILDKLNCDACYLELEKYSDDNDIALVCYEKSTDFCHRHIVADWFLYYGYNCEEL